MKTRIILCALLMVTIAVPALAGGPLLIFNPATSTPYAYPGPVQIWTDLGLCGVLSNAQADGWTAAGYGQWSGVATSSFSATVAGDFSAGPFAFGDVTLANAGSVIGINNGGLNDIHVIYDHDGTIISGFFGAPPGVLGIASPDFAAGGTPNLTESWAVMNGSAINPGDNIPTLGASFAGVFTHEFGHSINLAHTQLNGAVGFFGDQNRPGGCAAPYAVPLGFNDFETMYPFLDPSPGSVGIAQQSVDMLEDQSSISDVYPAATWPASGFTITGKIFLPDGVTELTGMNVIVRNVANPFQDAIAAVSGDFTQGALGPDGLYTFNGLTAGANYIVYVDNIVAGGFSTTPVSYPVEEYYNGANESANGGTDDPCTWVTISGAAGGSSTADIILNDVPGLVVLGDDNSVEVPLPFAFPFCGQVYSTVWVGANGFLTFGAADLDPNNWNETPARLLNGPPRIAVCWDDYSPQVAGTVTALPVGVDFVVTWDGVPQFGLGDSNTFSITLRSDGSYDCSYGVLGSTSGLAGRSEGGGAVDPGETDLTVALEPIGSGIGTLYEAFTAADNDLAGELLEFAPCGGPVPVRLAAFSATRSTSGAVIEWEVASAVDHAGFTVWRQPAGDLRTRVSEFLSGADRYRFVDERVPGGSVDYWLAEASRTGQTSWHGPYALSSQGIATTAGLVLSPARPNPFAASTVITFSLPEAGGVKVSVFDARGRKVRSLLNAVQGAGDHTLTWDGRADDGSRVAAGFYLLKVDAGSASRVQKMVLTP